MPWCETCSRFLNPNSLRSDGSCPTCGRVVAEPGRVTTRTGSAEGEAGAEAEAEREPERDKAPWHFKLLVLVTVLYLAWRAVQMIGWVVN